MNKFVCIFLAAMSFSNVTVASGRSESDTLPFKDKLLENFQFTDVHYFNDSIICNASLKGKWSIIYLWNEFCGSCIQSMPKLNRWYKEFGKNINILLVGYTGSQYSSKPNFHSIKGIYEKERKKHSLSLPIAFDSTIFHKYNVYSCPVILILDSNGIVRAKTSSIIQEDIDSIQSGKIPELPGIWSRDELPYNYTSSKPLLIRDNGGSETDFMCRSILSKWRQFMPADQSFKGNDSLFQVLKVDLGALYRYAYFNLTSYNLGKPNYTSCYPIPILRLADSSPFVPNSRLGINLYCYSLSGTKLNDKSEEIRNNLKATLELNFGYMVVQKQRMMPCWALIDIPTRDKDVSNLDTSELVMFSSSASLIQDIYTYNSSSHTVLIDETRARRGVYGIDRNCNMTDFKEINKWLGYFGAKLVEVKKLMNVIEISDARK